MIQWDDREIFVGNSGYDQVHTIIECLIFVKDDKSSNDPVIMVDRFLQW